MPQLHSVQVVLRHHLQLYRPAIQPSALSSSTPALHSLLNHQLTISSMLPHITDLASQPTIQKSILPSLFMQQHGADAGPPSPLDFYSCDYSDCAHQLRPPSFTYEDPWHTPSREVTSQMTPGHARARSKSPAPEVFSYWRNPDNQNVAGALEHDVGSLDSRMDDCWPDDNGPVNGTPATKCLLYKVRSLGATLCISPD